ncbi:putative SAM-dependent methyltransferase protein [metagenome]|uniref:Putative SAM-dependent methyltransferase protein n=1 Tax=metagenome TaxID=256318 RepID=A0A2P2C4T2_9ZZZZ
MSTPERDTVAAYDAYAADYRDGTTTPPTSVLTTVDRFAEELPTGARVLEIGSGPGRDARLLEAAGLSVRRTDVSREFVRLMRADGYEADVLDPLTDDLFDPIRPFERYDAVWADACLLHVARNDFPIVAGRLADATRSDGLLYASVKEGDGEEWSTHGHVDAPRHFVYWRSHEVREALEDSGWLVDEVGREQGERGEIWLEIWARRQ